MSGRSRTVHSPVSAHHRELQLVAPYGALTQHEGYVHAPPVRIHVVDAEGRLRAPFVYGLQGELDLSTFRRVSVEDTSVSHPLRFFARGEPYRFWGSIDGDRHLFDAGDEGRVFLLGTDALGRDVLSRILAGSRISLTIGLVGVLLSFVLGCILGGISGYFGGTPDLLIQRIIEFLGAIPNIPLWMALSASIPINWPVIRVYFAITIILSVLSWTGLSRVVRGKLLELREYDFVTAAKLAGSGNGSIIVVHLLPGFLSYLIVHLTLAIPGMILGDRAQLPRARHPAAGGELGDAAAGGAERDQHRHLPVAADAGAVCGGDGVALQFRRRWVARCRRSLRHERQGIAPPAPGRCVSSTYFVTRTFRLDPSQSAPRLLRGGLGESAVGGCTLRCPAFVDGEHRVL